MKYSSTLLAFLILLACRSLSPGQTTPADLVKEWERAKAYTKNYPIATNVKSPFGEGELEKSTTDKSKANITKIVLAGYDFMIASIGKMSQADLNAGINVFDKFDLTREQVLAKAFEHQTHHRGQTVVYLRLECIKPPQETLF